MRLKIAVCLFIGLLFSLAACSPKPSVTTSTSSLPPSTSVTSINSSGQIDAGIAFVVDTLNSLQSSGGWVLPVPPPGGQIPRVLTQAEKDRIVKIADAVPFVAALKKNPNITGMDTSFVWIGWNGHLDGEASLNYVAIENGTANLTTMGGTSYPAADFLFHSIYGDYGKFGIQVAVNLATGKVVWLGGYSQLPPPSSKNPPTIYPSPVLSPEPTPTHPPFSANVVFTKITASLTLSESENGTHIPWGSVIYHWANGITEAYSANNSLIFIAKDSEAAQLPHPSGPNGPFESPATYLLGVPNGALIVSDPSDNTTARVYLDPSKKTLILTIIVKSENYPLEGR